MNPRVARHHERGIAWLRESACVVAELATSGDEGDADRLVRLLSSHGPDVLVAAGGDGTVSLALRALLEAKGVEETALAMLPLGTGNNAARSFGLCALRDGPDAVRLALGAITSGPRLAVDVGTLDGRAFLGSVAIGMDADVLALRNRLRPRLDVVGLGAGWGLYLAASLGSLLSGHGAPAQLTLDGASERLRLFGLCVVNAPVYAGPIRFDAANDCTDGALDVLALRSGREYVEEYVGGWLRHLRVEAGAVVRPSARLRRAREIRVDLERPVAAQADGEWLAPAASYRIGVLPGAVRICLPDAQQ